MQSVVWKGHIATDAAINNHSHLPAQKLAVAAYRFMLFYMFTNTPGQNQSE
jgi:hypothetical protein